MERSLASWPRCILDPTSLTRSEIFPYGSWKNHPYLLQGSDGLLYLDYLGFSLVNYFYRWLSEKDNGHSIKENPEALALNVIKRHKKAILSAVQTARQCQEKTPLSLTKYYPLASYHNFAVNRLGLNSRSDSFNELKKFLRGQGKDPKILDPWKKVFYEYTDQARKIWKEELIDLDNLLV